MTTTIAFIGLGLIGGSIARAIKKASDDYNLIAYDTDDTIKAAISENIINAGVSNDLHELSQCRLVFLCAPVENNLRMLSRLHKLVPTDCLVTDVGSIKSDIMSYVESSNFDFHFVGGHPMTGSERTGFNNSNAILLENAYYILIPSSHSSEYDLHYLRDLICKTGAIPVELSTFVHDKSTAAISHIPHIVASALVRMVYDSDNSEQTMKLLAAGGFKDITRIASSSSSMWKQICMGNREQIVPLLDYFTKIIHQMRDCLVNSESDSLEDFFKVSKQYRDSLISNPITNTSTLPDMIYVTIEDRTGAIAQIATLLAQNSISIKNIGISHNREIAEGALCIEFTGQKDADEARKILTLHNFKLS